MTLDAFWKIIGEVRNSTKRASEIPEWLIEHLSQHDDNEIAEFDGRLRECMHRSYDAQLWLGAVILLGGCGDDGFDYFRAWLISQGREAFESALADADSMAAFEHFDGEFGVPRLENLLYAPIEAFIKRTGGDEFAARDRFETLLPPHKRPTLRNQELVNTSDKDARTLLPKLAARFPKPVPSRKEI
jgi:hypothetical protein